MWHGRGCDACHSTGHAGRLAIHEIFMPTEEVRHLIARNASFLDIQVLAQEQGDRPMMYDGLKKVLRGLTTLAEVERVTSAADE
jgi:type IV pilus assembly protein PilB